DAALLHENLGSYTAYVKGVHAVPDTNIANLVKIRKGNMQDGWDKTETTIDTTISFSPADHAALETRSCRVEILPDERVLIYSSTQGPHYIKKLFSQTFQLDTRQISVHASVVGGAVGGTGAVQLEFLAYLASKAVNGKIVSITNTRDDDLITSPVHIGLEATVKLGATKDGKLTLAAYH